MQPMPAAVTAWRKTSSLTSPAAKTPGTDVAVEFGLGQDVAGRLHLELAAEEFRRGCMADGNEDAVGRTLDDLAGLDVPEAHAGDGPRVGRAHDLVENACPR